jgi:hypothetical protein
VTSHLHAPARRVYDTIANYRTGHPRILPKQFANLTVDEGGVGAGTVIHFDFRVFGQTTTLRAVVTEPEPGRVLVERNTAGNDGVSTFIVEAAGPNESNVTIKTEMTTRSGFAGRIEAWMIRRILESTYQEELRLLEKVASTPEA